MRTLANRSRKDLHTNSLLEARSGTQTPTIGVGLYSYQIGGSEKVGAEVAIAYQRRGYRVFCFAFYDSDGLVRDRLMNAGVECLDLNYLRSPRGIRRLTYQLRLAALLRRRSVHGLHVHHATALILCGLPARAAAVRRIVMTEHAIHNIEEDPRYKASARIYCRLAHEITVVHAGLIEYFVHDLRIDPRKLHCIPNGVSIVGRDVAARRAIRISHSVNEDDFVYLFAGRLHPTKDLANLLRALAELRSAFPKPHRLWIVGEGDERPMLERLVDALHIRDRVNFIGPKSDVRPYLSAADAVVMSSRTEGLPMTLIEAMASGVPCIATGVGGIPELFAGGSGLVVPPGDPASLSAAMYRVGTDSALRQALVESASALVHQKYDIERVVDQYLDLLALPRSWPCAAAQA